MARDLADYLRTFRGPDGRPVVTIAFVPQEAPDTATFLALGCTEIVMGQGRDARQLRALLQPPAGAAARHVPHRRQPAAASAAAGQLRRRSATRSCNWPRSRATRRCSIHGLVRRRVWRSTASAARRDDRTAVRHQGRSWTDQQRDAGENDGLIKAAGQAATGQLLELDGRQGQGLRHRPLRRRQPAGPRTSCTPLYGIDPARVREAGPDWLDGLADFLGDPVVAMFLVIIGITCLILELKMPGIGVPGVIAALCFVLFFWSQSQMNGQITLLAVLLFLLGLVLIGDRDLRHPGLRRDRRQRHRCWCWSGWGWRRSSGCRRRARSGSASAATLTTFGFGLVVAAVVAFVVAPLPAEHPVRQPAGAGAAGRTGRRRGRRGPRAGSSGELAALLGAVGMAATMLRPAGMARIRRRVRRRGHRGRVTSPPAPASRSSRSKATGSS